MKSGLSILGQDGILGLFPEGGIWDPTIHRVHSGVAWLSYRAQAPVLPIGFGAMQGALKSMFTLKRPILRMNVGKVLPALKKSGNRSLKMHLQNEANRIMEAVRDFIPDGDPLQDLGFQSESFVLKVEVQDQTHKVVSIPGDRFSQYGTSFAKFTHRETLINNLIVNLGLSDVIALKQLVDRPPVEEILLGTQAVLSYLDQDNPYYFTYRYGYNEGKAMEYGIREIHNLARWAKSQNYFLSVTPLRVIH
jgi:hypothetical protein